MKKKFYKKLVGLTGMSIMAILCCTACSQGMSESPKVDVQQIVNGEKDVDSVKENQQEQEPQDQGQQESEKSDFYAGADLQGGVVEFSDSGFVLSPAKVYEAEDGGGIMMQAAPGAENEEDLVTITYASDVTFEIITMDSTSLTEISREDTDKQSVKKQSDVLVFGSCQDTYNWIADKVIIMRWK